MTDYHVQSNHHEHQTTQQIPIIIKEEEEEEEVQQQQQQQPSIIYTFSSSNQQNQSSVNNPNQHHSNQIDHHHQPNNHHHHHHHQPNSSNTDNNHNHHLPPSQTSSANTSNSSLPLSSNHHQTNHQDNQRLNPNLDLNHPSSSLTSLTSTHSAPPRSSSLTDQSQSLRPILSTHQTSRSMESFSKLSPEDQATAQHVRKVYAYLEQVGVPGDGFAEGIERTREHRPLSQHILNHQSQRRQDQRISDLAEAELAVLRSADRYGFFKNPSSDRSLLLHPLFFYPSNATITNKDAPPQPENPYEHVAETQIELRRISKWNEMLIGDSRDAGSNIISYRLNDSWTNQRDRFEKRCYKGIPDRWRRAGWNLLIKYYAIHKIPIDRSEHLSQSFKSDDQLIENYTTAIQIPSDQDVQIDLDVPRTINGHIFFHTRYGRGQRALFQVLHAFGMYCETCGYCQGMGPIAATLLNYFDAEMAYVAMVRLHDWYDFHQIFAPGFPGLVECFYIQERVIEYLLPNIHKVFTQQMISTSSFATKWYITLFANTVPFEAQLRLLDILLLEGMDVLILASVSIIYSLRTDLAEGNDFEMILSKLSSRFEMSLQTSKAWIRSIRKLGKQKDVQDVMAKARVQWKAAVKDGSASKKVT